MFCNIYMNEVYFVLNEINKNNYKLNDVAIYVTDSKYNNLIKALFENMGVPYLLTSGDDAEVDGYISLFKNILNFLNSHLSITLLNEIYKNRKPSHFRCAHIYYLILFVHVIQHNPYIYSPFYLVILCKVAIFAALFQYEEKYKTKQQ